MAHYLLERRLAARLFTSTSIKRGKLYTKVYTELFKARPDHRQYTAVRAGESRQIQLNLTFLRNALTSDAIFLEIGCGDADMSYCAAAMVKHAYDVGVTDVLINDAHSAQLQFSQDYRYQYRSSG